MKTDEIKELGIDAAGRLYIRPATVKFPMIWRSGAEVHWDEKGQFLYSPKPREWSSVDWFQHLIATAQNGDGGGVLLRITAATSWLNVPNELRQQLMTLPL